MRRVMIGASALALGAGGAFAGGIERSIQSTAILFEKGNYLEFSMGNLDPSVSGTQMVSVAPFSLAGSDSGNVLGSYTTWSLAVKTAITDKLDFALVLDQPVGADVDYFSGDTGYLYGLFGGSTATLDAYALTAMLRYKLPQNFSIIGGVRAQQAEGDVALFNGYTMSTSKELDYGYLVGVAWEKPEIAARVSLTYNSAITHKFDVTEMGADAPSFSTTVPESVNLEFQTGIAADTLLFGSVRWVDWTSFDITPYYYELMFGSPLVSHHHDTVTYTLGLGRKFNETWSGAFTVTHEPQVDGFSGNLGPTNGYDAVGLAATYTKGAIKITGGARYYWVGDTKTKAMGVPFGDFTDNDAIGLGLRVGYNF